MGDRRGGMGSGGKLARMLSALQIAVESDGILRQKPSIPDVPGIVVKTPYFQGRVCSFDPQSGN